jgi:hypothetical protein
MEDQVAVAIALPGSDQGEVGDDRSLEDELLDIAVESAGLLGRRGDRTEPSGP